MATKERHHLRARAQQALRPFDRRADVEREIPADAAPAVREVMTAILDIDPVENIHDVFSAVQDFAYGAPGIAHAVLPTIQGSVLVSRCGSTADQKRFRDKIAGIGKNAVTLLLAESGGRGPGEWTTRAERVGKNWVINGEKSAVNNNGGNIRVVAAKDGSGAIAIFLVEDPQPFGVIGGNRDFPTLALGASRLSNLHLKDLIVDDSSRVDNNDALAAARAVGLGRLLLGAVALGTASASLDYAREWVTKRTAFGKPLASFEGVAFDVAEADTRLEAARLMLHHVIDQLESSNDAAQVDDKVARTLAGVTAAAAAIAIDGVQLMGVHGIIHEHPQELFHRTASSLAVLDSDPLMSGFGLI